MSGPLRDKDDRQAGLAPEQADAVRAQIETILEDPLFRDTTRIKRFLRYVTEETLAGRGARLKGYTVGLEVFDKPPDFDPQLDTIVRVQAGQLRRRLDLYYAGSGESDPIRLTIPKGRYAPRFEVRTSETARLPAPSDLEPANDRDIVSSFPGVAILTLETLADSDYSEFFAEGLTAEIVSALVQFRHIRVIALRSTQLDCDPSSVRDRVGESHDVQFVLSGSVRRSGDMFRVVVNLTAADTGQILYTQSFDRAYSPDTLFELQESIASNVAATVAAPFGQINRFNRRLLGGRRQSISAYEAVLRFYQMGLSPSLEKAKALLSDIEAITADNPDFSSGFAIQAMLHTFLCTQCVPPADPDVHLKAALSLSERATRIDPQNSLAFFARFQALHHSGEAGEANIMAKRAMMLNPNDYSMLSYFAATRAYTGDLETAQSCDEAARSLVANPPHWFDAARHAMLFQEEKYEAIVESIHEIDESSTLAFSIVRIVSLGHLGRIEEGRALYKKLAANNPTYAAESMRTLEFWHVPDALKTQILQGWNALGIDVGGS
ncbi:hypothetical protein GCM10007853_13350 [Algimonas ampicilliniresistens]|uniref:TolB amino-terminal domain-containing protein n=1 Tax=Algimonas ampicilliniresistens TaxID=1298735 RepID=A0ABQ5V7F5_9PROT|nr:hypothetical protein [Algimonas ampicilliniresistens]GLQ23461.1 hypothetical protein GCM10007853_13350 [Algimonas ampicilliniresistens]